MNMINKGIPYFPTPANFFDEEVMELLEAKFGVLASYIVMRLLCKIYKEGYYISWGKEQNLIFVRKVGGGILGNHESGVQTGVSYEKFR